MGREDSAGSLKVSPANLASMRETTTDTTVAAEGHNGGAHAIRLTIPAKPEYITLGRLALTGISRLRAEPLPQEDLGDLKLALTEACTNSVRHAYAGGEGLVEIVYELHSDRLVVEVADEGEGFDLPAGAAVPSAGDELSEGGLGIALIRAHADELEIGERPQGGGSRLRFVKLLPAA
jgi:serine/threonine-protein kinase RsbW